MSVRDGASISLDRDMANVGVARRFVRTQLADAVADVPLSDLVLATSELVTNAFEHSASDPVVVDVQLNADGAAITVTSRHDHGQVASADQWTTAAPEQLTGRGLGIVRTLADRVEVRRFEDSLAITIFRQLAPG